MLRWVLALLLSLPALAQDFDFVLRNGTWPTSASRTAASAVGNLANARATGVIDATGKFVARGFIDLATVTQPHQYREGIPSSV